MARITFELNKKEYIIPQYLSIGDYQKIYKVKDFFNEEYFMVKLINIITGAPIEELMKAKREKIQKITEYILAIIPDQQPNFIDRFELDGVEYGFIPKWRNMSFAEYADLDVLMTRKPEEILANLHIITAIVYRPITKSKSEHKFEIEEYSFSSTDERAELFKNKLDVKFSLGSQFFFTLFAKKYYLNTLISSVNWRKLNWMLLKLIWQFRGRIWKSLWKKNSDGLWFYQQFQMMILQDTIQSLKKEL